MAKSSNKTTNLVTHDENNSRSTTTTSDECRICLSNFGDLPIYGDESSPDISMEIMTFGAIQVDELDPFPKYICEDCFRLLESAISFQKLAKRSDKILKRRKKKRKFGEKNNKSKAVTIKSINENICETETPNIDFVALPNDGNQEESYGEDDAVPLSQLVASNACFDRVSLENVTFNDTNFDNNETQNNDTQNNAAFLNEFQDNVVFNNEIENNVAYHIDVQSDVTYHINILDNQTNKNETDNYEALDNKANDNKIIEHEELDLEVLEDDENGNDNDSDMMMLIISDDKSKPNPDNYSCKICNLSFPNSKEYEEHRTTVKHKREYIMSFLPKKKKLPGEKKETVFPKDKKCDICNRAFTKLHYPRHMFEQHKIKIETARSGTKKECSICKQLFHPLALNRHMKTKHEADPPPKVKVECPVCHKMFSKDFYPLHIQRHEDETKNFICDQCGKKFFYKSTFYTHRLVHSNELPHKCDYCPYRGRTKGLLKTHVRTHTGDYPYKCTQCDTRCLTKSNLNAHLQRHRGPVDFICDTCNRGFYTKIQLERHILVIHLGIKNHVCNYCGLAFGYRHGLMSHQLNVHKRAKGVGKAKAVYLRLEEQGKLLQ